MHELIAFLQENPVLSLILASMILGTLINPVLSLILASMILGTLVKLAPWRRGGGDE